MARTLSFLTMYWRGGMAPLGVLATLIGGVVLASGLVWGMPWRWAAVGALILLTLWLAVGALRSANRQMQDSSGGPNWLIYAAVLGVLIFNGTSLISLALPPPDVVIEMRPMDTKVKLDGDDARVTGQIDYRVLTELQALVDSSIEVRRVVLESEGGNVIAGRSIGLYIAAQGLDTYVETVCYSACTLAFMGGQARDLGEAGRLGFHGYQFDSEMRVQTLDTAEIVQKDRAFLASRGVADSFVDQIFVTDPTQIWEPDRTMLRAAGVLTQTD